MSADLKQLLERRITDFFEAFHKKDSEAYMAFFTDDCHLYSPNKDVLKGKTDVAKALKEVEGLLGQSKLVGIGDLIQLNEEYVWTDSHSEWYKEDGKLQSRMIDVFLWKKIDGVWLVHRDAWTERSV